MARKLYINGKLANINGFTRGWIYYHGVDLEWNNEPESYEPFTLITRDDKWFYTEDSKSFIVVPRAVYAISQHELRITNNGRVDKTVVNLVTGQVSEETQTLTLN